MWSTLARAQRRRNNIGSYARFPLAEALKTMDLQRLNELETIDPRTLAPWRVDPFEKIEIDSDGEVARGRAEDIRSKSDIVVYSDASGRDGHLGAAVVAFATGPVRTVFKIAHQLPRLEDRQTTAIILCDSRSALQTIQTVRNRSGQRIVHAILQAATEAKPQRLHCAFSGYQYIVTIPATTLRTEWQSTPPAQANLIPSARY
ncbi:hypothetical protein MYU51_019615 [Penicillium brevicompactum]